MYKKKKLLLNFINILSHANHIPSQMNDIKVIWKVQRLGGE